MTMLSRVPDGDRWFHDGAQSIQCATVEDANRLEAFLEAEAERVRKLAAVAIAAESFGQECGFCGREGFGTEAVIIASGGDDGVKPCPECSPLVLTLAALDAEGKP